MKNILCFGDSLTWGFNPENAERFPISQRWTGILQQKLGKNFHIIEEGLNGRNTIFDDPFLIGRSGSSFLPVLLESHAPLDLVILLLGTNDIKSYIKGDARAAALGCGTLIRLIATSQASPLNLAPDILLLSPPLITAPKGFMATVFEHTEAESKKFAHYYQQVAQFYHVHFLDTGRFLTASSEDGVHLDEKNHQVLAEKLEKKLKEIFSKKHK